MRLIDLDQTIFVPIVDESNGGVEYEMEMTIGEMFNTFLDGFQPEIVDAVPVEWLENRLNTLCFEAMGAGALYGDRIGELAKSINEVMKLWQKEQGAR